MEVNERQVEAGETAIALQNERAIAGIRAGLAGEGSADCIDCGDPIEKERRAAMPSAKRCVECQRASERNYRA